jgi:hypothetical protein
LSELQKFSSQGRLQTASLQYDEGQGWQSKKESNMTIIKQQNARLSAFTILLLMLFGSAQEVQSVSNENQYSQVIVNFQRKSNTSLSRDLLVYKRRKRTSRRVKPDNRIISSHAVDVNLNLLTSLTSKIRNASVIPLDGSSNLINLREEIASRTVSLTLADTTYNAIIDQVIDESTNSQSWVGHFKENDGDITIVSRRGRLSGIFRVPDKGNFLLGRDATGGYELNQIQVDNKPCAIRITPNTQPPSRTPSRPSFPPPNGPASYIRVLVLYTPAARLKANGGVERGSKEVIDDMIAAMFADTNGALGRSRINAQIEPIPRQEIQYKETGDLYQDRPWLEENEEVHRLRDQNHADIVLMLVVNARYGGLANQMSEDQLGPQFASKAYGVVDIDSALNNRSFVHEFAHIFGCGHDVENTIEPGPGMYAYSAGYHALVTHPDFGQRDLRTIMAYRIHDNDPSIDQIGIGYFSNPSVTYPGASYQPVLGDANHNNAATINISAPIIARFR